MDVERLMRSRRGRHWGDGADAPTTPIRPVVLCFEQFATSQCHSCSRRHRSAPLPCKPN
jgi:hypothetical protein